MNLPDEEMGRCLLIKRAAEAQGAGKRETYSERVKCGWSMGHGQAVSNRPQKTLGMK